MLERLQSWLSEALDVAVTEVWAWTADVVPRLAGAVLVVAVGYQIANTVVRYAGRPVYHRVPRESVAAVILRTIKFLIVFGAFMLALRLSFGITLTSFLLTATVFSVVIGVVLAPLVGDIINGVFVLGDQPYEIGDMVELDTGEKGFVDDVTIRYTKVFTMDNTFLIIPNSEIRKRDVDNYSAEDIRTRQTIEVTVTYESDVETAREAMVESASETPEVIDTEGNVRIGKGSYPLKPTTMITEFGDHGVQLRLRYWVREPYRLPHVSSKIYEKIWQKFDERDVDVPYPHRHHVFDTTSGVAEVSLDQDAGAERGGGDEG